MCGNGILEGDEACDDGGEILYCNPDCTLPACGDGFLQGNEDCEDGNTLDGDGCKGDCTRYDLPGIAYNVKEYDLDGWEPCFVDTYQDGGVGAQEVNEIHWSCQGKNLLFACGYYDGDGQEMLYNVAVQGPRVDTDKLVNYLAGERFTAVGVAWGWAPGQDILGWAPEGNNTHCLWEGQWSQMCWKTRIQDSKYVMAGGGRCGSVTSPAIETSFWRRVVYQAD